MCKYPFVVRVFLSVQLFGKNTPEAKSYICIYIYICIYVYIYTCRIPQSADVTNELASPHQQKVWRAQFSTGRSLLSWAAHPLLLALAIPGKEGKLLLIYHKNLLRAERIERKHQTQEHWVERAVMLREAVPWTPETSRVLAHSKNWAIPEGLWTAQAIRLSITGKPHWKADRASKGQGLPSPYLIFIYLFIFGGVYIPKVNS